MGGSAGSTKDRFFAAFVNLGRARPGLVIGLILGLVFAGAILGVRIDINTSRFDMVRPDDPYQTKLLGFFERFGYPDAPVVAVHGAPPEQRRAAVDALLEGLAADPRFEGRALGRIGAHEVAEVMLLQRPEMLGQLRASLPPDLKLAPIVEGGLPTLMSAVESQLLAGLDGEVEVDEASAAESLAQLAGMARALDAQLDPSGVQGPPSGLGLGGEDDLARTGLDAEGYLVSRDGETHLVAVFPKFAGTQLQDFLPLVEGIRSIRDTAALANPGVQMAVTGLPVLVVDEEESVAVSIVQSGIASALGLIAVLLIAFRSLRMTLYALIPLTFGMGITVGLTQLIYGHLNPITAAMFAILLGLGIDFSVHLLVRFNELSRQGVEHREAVLGAIVKSGPGVVTGGLTSALACLTAATATFTAFGEFGVINAVGLSVLFVVTMFTVPILLDRFGAGPPPPPLPGLGRLSGVIRMAPRPMLALAVLLAGAAAWGASQVRFNPRYFDYLPAELESVQALDRLEKDGALSPLFAYTSAPDIEAARGTAERLRGFETVGMVQTPSDLFPVLDAARLAALTRGFDGLDEAGDPDFEKMRAQTTSASELASKVSAVVDALDETRFALEQAERPTTAVDDAKAAFQALAATLAELPDEGKPQLARIHAELGELLGRAWRVGRNVSARGSYSAEDLPPLFRARHVSRDGEDSIAVFVFPAEPIWAGGRAKAFSDDVRSVDPGAAGHAISMHVHNEMIVDDFIGASLLAIGIVLVVLYVDLRRISDALLAMTPVMFGAALMGGAMLVLGVRFSVGNLMVLPLLIGLGIDAGVHMIHRQRQSADANGCAPLEEMLSGTGSAVLVASVTTMVGFGALTVADYGGVREFGLTMVIGIGACLVATLFMLPALLLVIGRAK